MFLLNASVVVFDACTETVVALLEFPEVTHSPALSVSVININQKSGLLFIVVSTKAAFRTFVNNISRTFQCNGIRLQKK
jgi:hypothetical protein